MASLDKTSLKQVNHFVRGHTFIHISLSGHTTSQRRAFERDVYDYARGLGLQRREAKREVLKARGFCGEFDYDSDVSTLGDEVEDSAQLLAGLSGRPIASQSTPHNASTNQAETMPTPKLTHSKGKKKSRPSDANHGTLLDAEAGEALPEPPHPPKVAKKSKKRKATEIEEEATNPIEFPTPKEKSSRKTSKKSKDKSSTSEVVSQDIQPDDMKRASHRRTAKRQKLEQALDFLDTAKSSAYDDIEQQPDADLSALGNKQKKEKKKDKERKESKKAANPAGSSAIEVPASHKHGGGSSKERKTTKIEDQQHKDDEREVSRLDKIERRRKRREEEIMPNEDRHRDAEVREEDSEDRYTTYKRTEVAHGHLPHGITTSKHAESNDMVETLAEGTNVSSASGVDALRATTPELDSVDQPNLGLEVRSVYFTPEKKKPRKARSSPKVKLEMLEQERRKEAKEKQARFRAEIVAATRRLSIGQTGTIPLQIDTLDASRNVIADTPGELSQPTPQIAKAVESNEVETTAPTRTRPRKYQQSENMIDVISKEADISECTSKPFQELIDTLDSTQSARNEDLRQSKSRSSQQTGPAAIYGILSHERAVQNNAQEDGNFDEGIAGAAIEPVIPESLPKHNGWIPINHPSLAATGQPGYREGRTVFGSIRKPESGDGFISLDGASEDLGENFTLGTDIPVSSTGNRVLRKRKSRANADGGGDESVVVKSTRKPRNVKQEPLDFQSPMIQ